VIVLLSRVALLLAAILGWEILARGLNPLLYVPPSLVVPAIGRILSATGLPPLPEHFWLTLREILIAYAMAAGAGLVLGFVLGLRRILGEVYEPILAALYAVPSVVWYPTLMLLFGLGPASKIAFGVCLGFFPIVLAVLAGIRQVDRHLVTVARSMGAGPGPLFLKVLLPGMASTLIGGLRAGLALSVVGVIVGEILGSQAGLGYLINYAYGLLRTPEYVGLVLLAVVIVFAIDGMAALVEARAKRWAA
jgi:ABC-type nitrate/sulfonate/bicarbonate transport system permease component